MTLPDDFQNILIIKLKHLGDVLTTTPVLSAIRDAWPKARISYLINPGGEDLLRFHPDVSEVLTVPRSGGLKGQLAFLWKLRQRRFDLVLELSGGDRGAFLAWLSGAKARVGYRPLTDSRLDRRIFFTHLVTTVVESKHTVEYHLDALRVLGVEPGYRLMALNWPDEVEARVRGLLSDGGINPDKPYAVVHPSSRWMFKAWRPEGNAEVIDALRNSLDLPVVLTSGPDPKELAFAARVKEHVTTAPLDLTGRLTLAELAALIGGSRVFFGVDSLPMHMAAAVNTSAVALFGPSGEHMWGPWGHRHRVVAKDWPCRPCGRDGCDGSKISRCLVEIESAEVIAAIGDVLKNTS